MRGRIIRASRNIFTLKDEAGKEFDCRIKGKILKGVEGFYNPLAPGDWVEFENDPGREGSALITALEKRRNAFTRLNQKGLGLRHFQASQLLAANVDLVVCVTSPASPPFRPRFIDRLLVQGEAAGIPLIIVCNKTDLSGDDPDVEERLEDFAGIGYELLRVSAKTGEGMEAFRAILAGKLSVLAGQSGVGKSSLINALLPDPVLRVGDINAKYDRGNHITTAARLIEFSGPGGRGAVVDTPGVRRLVPDGVAPNELIRYMKEFAPLEGQCSFGLSCSHVSEPGCKIMEAVAAGVIHEDRYDSFLRIREELSALPPEWAGHD
ncbi:MAG: ribosome small subunit-dependent GTPase A [Spirochaetaceae bacterium]|jgi:ribosome biogenesis GTPase|nr:ribosome small subunit-dependent GTPase A [Spirochaetaceae bacterium]